MGGSKMINMKDLIKKQTNMIRKESGMKINEAGINKSYKAIMKLEKEIDGLEKIFRREKSGMVRDRAKKMEKSILLLVQKI